MTYDLFVFGNPLLDLQVKDVDKKVLEKYDLKADDAILVEEKHESIYDYVRENFEIAYVAGGAAQNTARAAQVCLYHENALSGQRFDCDSFLAVLCSSACRLNLLSMSALLAQTRWRINCELQTTKKVFNLNIKYSPKAQSQQALALSSSPVIIGASCTLVLASCILIFTCTDRS